MSSTRFPTMPQLAQQVAIAVAASLITAWLLERFAPGSRPAN